MSFHRDAVSSTGGGGWQVRLLRTIGCPAAGGRRRKGEGKTRGGRKGHGREGARERTRGER